MPFRSRQLEYFITVAEEGQITRAAAKLHMAQPALSQAITQLESEMGVKLLERHPRGVSLTPAGELFYPKARAVVEREAEATQAASSLRRASSGTIELGFIGPPPTLSAPELLATLSALHPEAEVSLRDVSFPTGTTTSWLREAGVDAVFCHTPAAEEGLHIQPVRLEPRAVVAHISHRLAGREEVGVEEVLDEVFLGYHPDVQPEWSAFHSLDSHRGGPPRERTSDNALTSMQMLSAMVDPHGITTVPMCDAMIAVQVLRDVSVIPLTGAEPSVLSLTWSEDSPHPLLESLASSAERLVAVNGNGAGAVPVQRLD